MTLCTCGHDTSAHAEEGVGYCFADKLNGDPCDCGRFTADQAAAEISGRAPIPEQEASVINDALRELVARACQQTGILPVLLIVSLPETQHGAHEPIAFELIFDGTYWFYQAVGTFEIGGVPDLTWKVVVRHVP